MTKSSYRKLFLATITVGLFLPIFDAQALNPLSGIAYNAASNLFAYSLQIVFSMIGTLMGVLVQLLAWTVNIRIYTNVPVIQESWKIMRDFANMLFIIALIVMAYGTIFNIPKYDFKSLIPRFIVVAVLINFSLVLGGLMIDLTQVLNNTFLNAMGDISGQLGQGLNVTSLLPASQNLAGGGEAVSNLAFSAIVNLLFGIFMAFAIVVSVAVPLVISFVRIPILWALLIVSPMAWLLSILPATKGTFDKWWHQFLGWNLFLPYYLFSLYFALYFLGNMPKVINGLGQTFVDQSLTGLGGNFTFSLIFSYVLAAVFLIGGTKVAMSAGTFSGTGIVGVAKWGRERVMRRTGARGFLQAAKEKGAEIQAGEGRLGKIFGGPPTGLDTSRKLFGVRGADIKQQREFLDRSGKELSRIEDEYSTGKLKADQLQKLAQSTKANSAEGYAYRKLAVKKGLLNENQFADVLAGSSNNPLAIQDLVKTAKEAKFNGIKDLKSVVFDPRLDNATFTPARRELLFDMASDTKLAAKLTSTEIDKAVSILGGENSPETRQFLKKMGDVRPDLVAQRKSATSGIDAVRESYKLIKIADAKKLADLPVDVWRNSNFINALRYKVRILNKRVPAIPEGTLFPRGTPPPVGAPAGITLPNGDIVIPGKPGAIPGGRKFKGRLGGGDRFKTQLDNMTTGNIVRNRIVATL
jgi:hypothetical protein